MKIFYLPSDSGTESSESILDWNAPKCTGDKLPYRQISSNHGLQSDAHTRENKSEPLLCNHRQKEMHISEMTGY